MIVHNTPVEDHREALGLVVKREDLCCPPLGPPFSKTRGVLAHVAARPETEIGVLDSEHSQAGHAVAWACQIVGKHCVNFYRSYKANPGPHPAQLRSAELGAELIASPAARPGIPYARARKAMAERGGYLMPNALKLPETVSETAAEVGRSIDALRSLGADDPMTPWLIAVSSGTIAAGVVRGARAAGFMGPFILHMGYDRPEEKVQNYVRRSAGVEAWTIAVNERFAYRDRVELDGAVPFPANEFYDAKAIAWWLRSGRAEFGHAILWLIG